MLTVYHGVVKSGKSEELIRIINNFRYNMPHLKLYIGKPKIDDRDGMGQFIASRNGTSVPLTTGITMQEADVIFIDECQFLNQEEVDGLVVMSLQGKDVYVCGLRNSHLGKPFTSTSYLMGLADHIREVITLCCCKSKATRNIYTGAPISSEIEVGNNFMGVCSSCYLRRTEDKWVDTLGEKYETR